MDHRFDMTVIGGGIVGLAAAMNIVERYPNISLAVLEKEHDIARHQTGHNSGVIHSGIYYRPGSLKATNCVEGAAAMIRFCREHDIRYEICGKVVVATTQTEIPGLHELFRRGTANGVANITLIGPERLRELEPHAFGIEALHVPGTGITDYRAVAAEYARLIQTGEGQILTDCRVTNILQSSQSIVLETTRGTIESRYAINCAGLHSDRLMQLAGDTKGLRIIPFRGEYYEIAANRQNLVRNLIYPVADPNFPFLGVHFTRRISGGVEAGPNAVLAFKREGYRKTDISLKDVWSTASFGGFWRMAGKYWASGMGEYYRSLNKASFARALQKLLPEIQSSDLIPGGSGVRAQALDQKGALLDDFCIVPSRRMIHVCNVPSPAATASLMIGNQITEICTKSFDLHTAAAGYSPAR